MSDLITAKDTTVEIKVEFEGQNSKWSEQSGIQMIVLVATVKLACRARVNDVRITIYTPSPIVCSQESVNIGDIGILNLNPYFMQYKYIFQLFFLNILF